MSSGFVPVMPSSANKMSACDASAASAKRCRACAATITFVLNRAAYSPVASANAKFRAAVSSHSPSSRSRRNCGCGNVSNNGCQSGGVAPSTTTITSQRGYGCSRIAFKLARSSAVGVSACTGNNQEKMGASNGQAVARKRAFKYGVGRNRRSHSDGVRAGSGPGPTI